MNFGVKNFNAKRNKKKKTLMFKRYNLKDPRDPMELGVVRKVQGILGIKQNWRL